MQTLLDDLRYAVRQLRNSPGFTITAVLTLALGIGATTAIFTLVYDVLLKPLPYSHPEQLVVMEEQVAEFRDIYPTLPMNANHFVFWQQHSQSFQSMAVMEEVSLPLGMGGHPLQIGVLNATPGIFSVLDSAPLLGRAFSPQEAQPGHEHVVVLMDSLWRTPVSKRSGDPGKNHHPQWISLYRDWRDAAVVPSAAYSKLLQPGYHSSAAGRGTAADGLFQGPVAGSDGRFRLFWTGPPEARSFRGPGERGNQCAATYDHGSLSAEEKATLSATLTPFQQSLVGNNQKPLLILLAAVAGLLLVGCVNITNLLLARAVGKRQAMAVAAALGASRGEMLRLAMRETAVLATLGGALGILLATIIMPAMQRYLPPALDFRGSLHLDWAGAGCAVLLAVLATLLAGAAPAWMIARTPPQEVLHSESRLASESRSSKRIRRMLVAVEVAVSVALVLMTGLLTTSLLRLLHVDRGFEAARIATAMVDLPSKSYADLGPRVAFYKQVLDRLSQLPGVEHAAVVSELPLSGDRWLDMIHLPGDARPIMQLPTEHFRWVTPGYFETIHLPLIAGRLLSPSDEGKHYAVISELTARTLWPGKNPIGQQFSRAGLKEDPFTVIGVVGNARTVSLAAPDPMMVYMPYWYRSDTKAGLLVRTHQDPATMADAMRKAIWSVDPEVPVPDSADAWRCRRRLGGEPALRDAVAALVRHQRLAAGGLGGLRGRDLFRGAAAAGDRFAAGARRATAKYLSPGAARWSGAGAGRGSCRGRGGLCVRARGGQFVVSGKSRTTLPSPAALSVCWWRWEPRHACCPRAAPLRSIRCRRYRRE